MLFVLALIFVLPLLALALAIRVVAAVLWLLAHLPMPVNAGIAAAIVAGLNGAVFDLAFFAGVFVALAAWTARAVMDWHDYGHLPLSRDRL